MRCEHCGREQSNAEAIGSTHCNPPFVVQPHAFNGRHPADVFEAENKASVDRVAVRLGIEPEPHHEANVERHGGRLDTSTLGPVKHDPGVEGINARVVREALQALAYDDTTNAASAHYLAGLINSASDYTLNRLRRLLK